MGSFGEVKWLGNLYIVLFYNAVFAVAASFCLVNKFTARVRREILRRFEIAIRAIVPVDSIKSVLSNCVTLLSDGAKSGQK